MRGQWIAYETGESGAVKVRVNEGTARVLADAGRDEERARERDARHIDPRRPEECAAQWTRRPPDIEEAETRCDLRRALAALPEPQGRRIAAHFFGGMSYRQIALRDGVSHAAVGSSIRCGLRAMRAFLQATDARGVKDAIWTFRHFRLCERYGKMIDKMEWSARPAAAGPPPRDGR